MRFFLCVAVLAASIPANASTYAVGNEDSGAIVAVPANTVIGTPGTIYDLALDGSGNYIVASIGSLQKVTPGGVVSTIASAPADAAFISVAVDGSGNFIVADNGNHEIWRISPTGSSVTSVAFYPFCTSDILEDVTVRVNGGGNYVVMNDNCGSVAVAVITPGGTVTPVTLTQTIPEDLGGFTFDGSGNYVVAGYSANTIYSITTGGTVSTLSTNALLNGPLNIARDPSSGNYVVANGGGNSVLLVTPGGSASTLDSNAILSRPNSVVVLASPPATTPAPPAVLLTLAGLILLGAFIALRRRTVF